MSFRIGSLFVAGVARGVAGVNCQCDAGRTESIV